MSLHSIVSQLGALMARIESTSSMLRSTVDSLACRLHDQYPGDVGVFCVYLLNYTVLQPGDALFLAANEPHAYISGDCAEIMATSDNVVRAGLTPKWMDIETLCSCLTYNDGDPHYVEAEKDANQNVWTYCPPIDEFMLERVELADGEQARRDSCVECTVICHLYPAAYAPLAAGDPRVQGGSFHHHRRDGRGHHRAARG